MGVQEADPARTSAELEFRVDDRELFFVEASARGDCRVELAEMVHRADGRLLEYFTVTGASPEGILDVAGEASGIDDARLVREADDHALFAFVVSGACVGGTLAAAGAVVREVVAVEGAGRVTAYVPDHVDVREVVETVGDRHDAELLARRRRDRPAPAFTGSTFRDALLSELTERQWEALRSAYAGGYFEWPRERTASECAEALGIAQPTFTEHLRAGERKLLDALVDESVEPPGPSSSDER